MKIHNTILLVGHCGPDTSSLISYLDDILDDPTIKSIEKASEAELYLSESSPDLILVNRILPLYNELGYEWIKRLYNQYSDTAFMLISNHEDAQKIAVKNGAYPGFGKKDLFSPEATQKIKQAIR